MTRSPLTPEGLNQLALALLLTALAFLCIAIDYAGGAGRCGPPTPALAPSQLSPGEHP